MTVRHLRRDLRMAAQRQRIRIVYYNLFSKIYDRFISLHSCDRGGTLREELACAVGLQPGDKVLDLCTGTGSLLPPLLGQVGEEGRIIGVDFSSGMLAQARRRVDGSSNVDLVNADVTDLPFRDNSFDGATCSHAFYELKGDEANKFLREIYRVLKPGKRFLMMEHEVPKYLITRMLFYLRILSMGSAKALEILRHERETLLQVFPQVEKTLADTGRSKIFACTKR